MKEKFETTQVNAGWPLNSQFIINTFRKGRRFVRRETLYLLVDYNCSMTGYHGLIDMLIKSIKGSKTFKEVKVYYFHNGPSYSANQYPLKQRYIYNGIIPDMNKVEIAPSIPDFAEDHVYTNRELFRQIPLTKILNGLNSDSRVMLISDFGAVKSTFSSVRLLNALTFWKMVKQLTPYAVWFNPCPAQEWEYSTGEQLAKYIPLHVLDFEGFGAIKALFKEVKPNSKPAKIKKPVKQTLSQPVTRKVFDITTLDPNQQKHLRLIQQKIKEIKEHSLCYASIPAETILAFAVYASMPEYLHADLLNLIRAKFFPELPYSFVPMFLARVCSAAGDELYEFTGKTQSVLRKLFAVSDTDGNEAKSIAALVLVYLRNQVQFDQDDLVYRVQWFNASRLLDAEEANNWATRYKAEHASTTDSGVKHFIDYLNDDI